MAGLRATLAGLAAAAVLLGACAEREVILEGERFDPRTPLDASIPVEGEPPPVDTAGRIENRAEPIALPAAAALADWTQRGGNARHLVPHASLSAAPARVWTAPIGSGDSRRSRITAAPVIAGGQVFAMDSGARVSAVSLAGGAAQWSVSLVPPGARSDLSGGGLAFDGGRLFATTGYGEVVALEPASGRILWRQRLGAPAAGAPAAAGGLVFAVGRDSSAWAIDARNGRVQWQVPGTPSTSGFVGAAAPAVADGVVYLPFSSGEVTATQIAGGVRQWSAAVAGERRGRGWGGITDITGDPVAAGNTVYIGNQSGRTVAVDAATGLRRWTAREGAYGVPLVVGGSVFIVSDEARLVRLDAATGATIWSVELPYFTTERERRRRDIVPHYGPALAGGRLVVASGDGRVRFFDPRDGSLAGQADLPGGAAAPPAFAQGLMVVVTRNGQIHAFR